MTMTMTMTMMMSTPRQPSKRNRQFPSWRLLYRVSSFSVTAHTEVSCPVRCYRMSSLNNNSRNNIQALFPLDVVGSMDHLSPLLFIANHFPLNPQKSLNSGSSFRQYLRPLVKPISAIGSGLEASITDLTNNDIHVKNAEIVVESQSSDKMQVRVNVSGVDTRIIFDKVLINLARTAPPVPGFRLQKGGKTSKVPKDFLLQMLGEERVTNFVIQEIVSSVLADFAKQENLTVKDNKICTLQTAEELRSLFVPGNEFGFNATLELEKSANESPV